MIEASTCWECEMETEDIHMHHPVPKSRGGTKVIPLCGSCHAKAHHRRGNMSNSALVREAYARKKALNPDHPWGNPRIGDARELAIESNQKKARAYNRKIKRHVTELRSQGMSMADVVKRFHELGIVSRRGKPYSKMNLYRVMREDYTAPVITPTVGSDAPLPTSAELESLPEPDGDTLEIIDQLYSMSELEDL